MFIFLLFVSAYFSLCLFAWSLVRVSAQSSTKICKSYPLYTPSPQHDQLGSTPTSASVHF